MFITLAPGDWSLFFLLTFLISLLLLALGAINPKLVIIKPLQRRKSTFFFYSTIAIIAFVGMVLTTNSNTPDTSDYAINLGGSKCFKGHINIVMDDSNVKGGNSTPYIFITASNFLRIKAGNFINSTTEGEQGTNFDYCIYVVKSAPKGIYNFSIDMNSTLGRSKESYKNKVFVTSVLEKKENEIFANPQETCSLFRANGFKEIETVLEPTELLCSEKLILEDDKIGHQDSIALEIKPSSSKDIAKEISVSINLNYSYSKRDLYRGPTYRQNSVSSYIKVIEFLLKEIGEPVPNGLTGSISSKASMQSKSDENLEFLRKDYLIIFEYHNSTLYGSSDWMNFTIDNWHLSSS